MGLKAELLHQFTDRRVCSHYGPEDVHVPLREQPLLGGHAEGLPEFVEEEAPPHVGKFDELVDATHFEVVVEHKVRERGVGRQDRVEQERQLLLEVEATEQEEEFLLQQEVEMLAAHLAAQAERDQLQIGRKGVAYLNGPEIVIYPAAQGRQVLQGELVAFLEGYIEREGEQPRACRGVYPELRLFGQEDDAVFGEQSFLELVAMNGALAFEHKQEIVPVAIGVCEYFVLPAFDVFEFMP